MARIGRRQMTLLLEARGGAVRIRANDPALHGVRKNAAAALIRRGFVERVKVPGIGARGQSWNFASVQLTKVRRASVKNP